MTPGILPRSDERLRRIILLLRLRLRFRVRIPTFLQAPLIQPQPQALQRLRLQLLPIPRFLHALLHDNRLPLHVTNRILLIRVVLLIANCMLIHKLLHGLLVPVVGLRTQLLLSEGLR